MVAIRSECPADGHAIETLLDTAFGPGRHVRSGYLLRGDRAAVPALSFVALDPDDRDHLLGSIRFTPICLQGAVEGPHCALLLGPLAVTPARQRNGVGLKLVARGLEAAAARGHDLVFLLGEPAYYARAGFAGVVPGRIRLPVPFDPARLMVLSLEGRDVSALEGSLGGPC